MRLGGARRPAGYGGCVRRVPAVGANAVLPGQALGRETRIRVVFSATRAAIVTRCKRKLANSARAHLEALGAAAREPCISQ